MSERTTRILLIYCTITLIVPLLAAAFLGTFMRPLTDDYCTSALGRDHGLIGGLIVQYQTWAGQPLNILIKNLVGILGAWTISLLPALLLVGLTIACIWLMRGLPGLTRGAGLVLGLAFTLALYEGAPAQLQAFHWLAAAVPYGLPLIGTALLTGLVLRAAQTETAPGLGTIALFAMIAAISAGFSEAYLATQGGALAALWLWAALDRRGRWLLPLLTSGVIATGVIALVMIAAPGNAVRRAAFPDPLPLPDFVETVTLHTLALMVLALTVFSPLGAALLTLFPGALGSRPLPVVVTRRTLIGGVGVLLASVGGLMAAGVYANSFAPPARTYHLAVFGALLLLLLLVLGWWLAARWRVLLHPSGRRAAAVLVIVLITALAIDSLAGTINRLPLLRDHAAAWDARDRLIMEQAAAGQRDLVVPPLVPDLALADGLLTIGPDPTHWVNVCAAQYYQVDSLRTDG